MVIQESQVPQNREQIVDYEAVGAPRGPYGEPSRFAELPKTLADRNTPAGPDNLRKLESDGSPNIPSLPGQSTEVLGRIASKEEPRQAA